jgi:hypothetical protein
VNEVSTIKPTRESPTTNLGCTTLKGPQDTIPLSSGLQSLLQRKYQKSWKGSPTGAFRCLLQDLFIYLFCLLQDLILIGQSPNWVGGILSTQSIKLTCVI